MIQSLVNISIERRKLVGPVLLACLIFLRIPYLIGVTALFHKLPFLLGSIFNNGTFFITSLLIWWERDRLSEFHITRGVLVIFIWAPLVSLIISLVFIHEFSVGQIPLFHLLISFWLLWILKKSNFKNQQSSNNWIIRISVAVLVGICLGTIFGYVNGQQNLGGGIIGKHRTFPESVLMLLSVKSWVTVLPLFMVQLTTAATLEEPLFRGFLWGYLKNSGWEEKWILLFQAFLFWIGHIYYWSSAPYSFWIIVPFAGLILGFLAWTSRSIVTSMVSHGLFNSIGDFLAHF